MSILRHLGEDSALTRLDQPWPLSTHIAVRTLEELSELTRVNLAAAGVKRSKLPPRLTIPRPNEKPPPPPPSIGWVGELMDAPNGIEVVSV